MQPAIQALLGDPYFIGRSLCRRDAYLGNQQAKPHTDLPPEIGLRRRPEITASSVVALG
jgi:hypothetical protein